MLSLASIDVLTDFSTMVCGSRCWLMISCPVGDPRKRIETEMIHDSRIIATTGGPIRRLRCGSAGHPGLLHNFLKPRDVDVSFAG